MPTEFLFEKKTTCVNFIKILLLVTQIIWNTPQKKTEEDKKKKSQVSNQTNKAKTN